MSPEAAALVTELRDKYVWWAAGELRQPPGERVLAQVMDIGTYEDIRRIERTFGADSLAEIMRSAAPGRFSEPSWGFWRDRLELTQELPDHPPKRAFLADCP